MFLGKGVLKICSKFTGGHPCRSVISIKLLRNFIEITLRHGCIFLTYSNKFRIKVLWLSSTCFKELSSKKLKQLKTLDFCFENYAWHGMLTDLIVFTRERTLYLPFSYNTFKEVKFIDFVCFIGKCHKHRVKSVRIRSSSGSYFPAFGMRENADHKKLCSESCDPKSTH